MKYPSWGLVPKVKFERYQNIFFGPKPFNFDESEKYLARGAGRSYGDSCLNDGHVLLVTESNNRFIDFDSETGLLTCQASVTLDEILKVFVPKGWFLPVTPGTKFITVGGAVANDVHGKNHHAVGNFGHFVKEIELLMSGNQKIILSETENKELFYATIGGLGLTGVILKVSFYLKKIASAYIDQEQIRFSSLSEFFALSRESEAKGYEYTVAWVDCVNGKSLKGIFIRGNHCQNGKLLPHSNKKLNIPFFFPSWVLNKFSISLFNHLYYWKNFKKIKSNIVHYDPFFYPLDGILNWNRIYGREGFFQYQLVLPNDEKGQIALGKIFSLFKAQGMGSFLAVLKTFGNIPSKGLLSFPIEGVTLALDFANKPGVIQLFQQCDEIVKSAGGRVYPAKDANMNAESFHAFYPRVSEFRKHQDPKMSSSFSRRVQL